ncbi:MAG: hypothetical protein GY941_01355 [Planctomycetes bacterium]|nr:hypothetical protein [Planctomycetota bacterium]
MDNGSQWASSTTTWKPSGGPNPYGGSSLYRKSSGSYDYDASDVNGSKEVSLWWTQYPSRCNIVPVDIYDGSTLIDTVYVNHQANGGKWNPLGTYSFSGTVKVAVNSKDGCSTSADAVKIIDPPQDTPATPLPQDGIMDNGSQWTPSTTTWRQSGGPNPYGGGSLYRKGDGSYDYEASDVNGSKEVSLWWTQYPSRCSIVPVDIYDGSTLIDTVYVNHQANGGKWNPLGSYSFNGTVKVAINSQAGCSTSADAVKIEPSNNAPVLSPIGNKSVNEGDILSFTVSAIGANGDTLAYTAENLPLSALFDQNTNTFTWSPTYDQSGSYPEVTFQVSDGNNIDTESITINVANTNRAPVLDPLIDVIDEYEGDLITLNPTANDPDVGDTLTFTYTGWMTSNTYTPSHDDEGPHTVRVTVSDGLLSDFQDITIKVHNVNQVPILDHIENITVNEGDTITLNPTANDLDGDSLTFTYTGWMTSNTRTTSSGDADTYTVTVTVDDGLDSDSQDIIIQVNQVTTELQLSFTWTPNTETDLAGYKIHYGNESRVYNSQVDVGNQTNHTIAGLVIGETYYIAATAYDTFGNSSDYSQEVIYTPLPANGIIDNDAPGTSQTGSWPVSSALGFYGTDSLYSKQLDDTYILQASEVNDTYEVSMCWTYWSSRCTSVAVDVYDGNMLIDTLYVNQLSNAGLWNVLGTYEFSGTGKVVVNSQGGCSTNVDAVKFVK